MRNVGKCIYIFIPYGIRVIPFIFLAFGLFLGDYSYVNPHNRQRFTGESQSTLGESRLKEREGGRERKRERESERVREGGIGKSIRTHIITYCKVLYVK